MTKEELAKIKKKKDKKLALLQEYSTYVCPFFFSSLDRIADCHETKADFVWIGHISDSKTPLTFLLQYDKLLAPQGIFLILLKLCDINIILGLYVVQANTMSEYLALDKYISAQHTFTIIFTFGMLGNRPYAISNSKAPNSYLAYLVLIGREKERDEFSFHQLKKLWKDYISVKQTPARVFLKLGKVFFFIFYSLLAYCFIGY